MALEIEGVATCGMAHNIPAGLHVHSRAPTKAKCHIVICPSYRLTRISQQVANVPRCKGPDQVQRVHVCPGDGGAVRIATQSNAVRSPCKGSDARPPRMPAPSHLRDDAGHTRATA